MKRTYKRNYDSNYYGLLKETSFGWEWTLFKINETIHIKKGKEKIIENAITSIDFEYQHLSRAMDGWNPVNVQETSHDNKGSSVTSAKALISCSFIMSFLWI